MQFSARQTALNILNAVDAGPHHLDRIISDLSGSDEAMLKQDRNLVNALVYGVLRWRKLLDWIISQHSSKLLAKIDPAILNILRIGIFQIYHLDRIPVSAAVNTSVDMAKKIAPSWVVGFVNAVLRNASRNKQTLVYPDIQKNPQNAIPIITSFPEWLIERWIKRFGVHDTLKLCNACNVIPALTIRTNTLKTTREQLISQLDDEADNICQTQYSPDGISFKKPLKPVSEMKSFKEGLFQVQDEAAQLISLALAPRPGEIIIDACAGLGGKTGHIAQLMKNNGRLIALDKDFSKISRLTHDMNRLGIEIVSGRIADLMQINLTDLEKFDRILLDAPCSGIGVIRRNPDIKWDYSRQNLRRYQDIQIRLLDKSSLMIKKEGVVVYSVCSFEPEENEMVIDEFLQTHAGFEIFNLTDLNLINLTPFLDKNGFFRSLPHVHPMDGFFCACLKKIS